jgi:adenosylcobinamide kinase / adenosylcobinamide-phosphate guanylyltransferase
VSLTVLVGGARSGKSTLALRLAEQAGGPVTFLATGEALDDEMAERIAEHRRERPAGWTTVEEPVDLRGAVERAPAGVLVVDCLSLWVANLIERSESSEIENQGAAAAEIAAARAGTTIAVTNEVGLGVVPVSELGRRYRDVLGRVNAAWVAAAERSYLVVAGRTLELS